MWAVPCVLCNDPRLCCWACAVTAEQVPPPYKGAETQSPTKRNSDRIPIGQSPQLSNTQSTSKKRKAQETLTEPDSAKRKKKNSSSPPEVISHPEDWRSKQSPSRALTHRPLQGLLSGRKQNSIFDRVRSEGVAAAQRKTRNLYEKSFGSGMLSPEEEFVWFSCLTLHGSLNAAYVSFPNHSHGLSRTYFRVGLSARRYCFETSSNQIWTVSLRRLSRKGRKSA